MVKRIELFIHELKCGLTTFLTRTPYRFFFVLYFSFLLFLLSPKAGKSEKFPGSSKGKQKNKRKFEPVGDSVFGALGWDDGRCTQDFPPVEVSCAGTSELGTCFTSHFDYRIML